METTTIIYLLIGIITLLLGIIIFQGWLMLRKNDEIEKKNDVIVREVRRNQTLIDRAVQHGISRAALL